jgi:hypothetical protein
MSMTDKPTVDGEKVLDKMTVKDLREVAKEIPEITGVHGMKKDELLEAVKQARGVDNAPAVAPTEKPGKKKAKGANRLAGLPVQELKTMIKDLKAKRSRALAEKDQKMARIYRRRISRIKKRTRQAA